MFKTSRPKIWPTFCGLVSLRPIIALICLPLLATCGGGSDSTGPSPATALAFGVQPTAATAGVPLAPVVNVQVIDADGQPATTSGTSISLAIASKRRPGRVE